MSKEPKEHESGNRLVTYPDLMAHDDVTDRNWKTVEQQSDQDSHESEYAGMIEDIAIIQDTTVALVHRARSFRRKYRAIQDVISKLLEERAELKVAVSKLVEGRTRLVAALEEACAGLKEKQAHIIDLNGKVKTLTAEIEYGKVTESSARSEP